MQIYDQTLSRSRCAGSFLLEVAGPVAAIRSRHRIADWITAGRRVLVESATPVTTLQRLTNPRWLGASWTRIVAASKTARLCFTNAALWILALRIEAIAAGKTSGSPLVVCFCFRSKNQRSQQHSSADNAN